VLSDIDLSECINFLEIGCGVGNLLFPLVEYYPNWRLHGIDFSHTALDLLNRRALEEGLVDRGKFQKLAKGLPGDGRQLSFYIPL